MLMFSFSKHPSPKGRGNKRIKNNHSFSPWEKEIKKKFSIKKS